MQVLVKAAAPPWTAQVPPQLLSVADAADESTVACEQPTSYQQLCVQIWMVDLQRLLS